MAATVNHAVNLYHPIITTILDVLTALAAVATAAALILAIRQTRAALEAVAVSHFDAAAGRMLDLDLAVIQKPSLRQWIYSADSGRIPLPESGVERQEALVVVEFLVDLLDSEMLRNRTFPGVAKKLPDFEPWLAHLLHESEPACYFVSEASHLYSDHLIARFADLAAHRKAAWCPPTGLPKAWSKPALLSARWKEACASLDPWDQGSPSTVA